jgi:hypothetical protein
MHKSTLAILGFVICFSCTVRPPLTMDAARASLISTLSSDTIRSLKGNGTAVFAQNGEQFSASFDISWNGDSAFSAQFYGPLGMTFASIRSVTAVRWLVSAGDSQYVQHPSQRVRVGQGFLEYPFTWEELLAALTLRYPCRTDLGTPPDSMFTDRKTTRLLWKARRFHGQPADISVSLDNKSHRLSEITYSAREGSGEKVIFGGFLDGRPKEIRIITFDSNYFYVKYHALTVNPRKAFSP